MRTFTLSIVAILTILGASCSKPQDALAQEKDAEPTTYAVAPSETYHGPNTIVASPNRAMWTETPWIIERLQDETFVTLHRLPESRVDTSQVNEPNQVGVGVELTGSERFANFGNLNWLQHPSGHYAAVIAYTVERARALRIALNLVNFPENLVVKFINADPSEPYPKASLDYARAQEYLDRDVSIRWSPIYSGDMLHIELNYPDTSGVEFKSKRVELPSISYIFSDGPWESKAQPHFAPVVIASEDVPEGEKKVYLGPVAQKSRIFRPKTNLGTYLIDISSVTPNKYIDKFSRATSRIEITRSNGKTVTCTGHLINDCDDTTFKPYMLTAEHCIGTQAEAASIIALWDYRTDEVSSRTYGSELLVTNPEQDWSLLILGSKSNPANLPEGRVFLGWDSTPPKKNEILHHVGHSDRKPQTYARGIVTATETSYRDTSKNVVRTKLMQIDWETGLHAGGASGSVLVKIDGGMLYARSGGLSGSPNATTYTIKKKYKTRAWVVPFSRVYSDQKVANYLGSGQRGR